MKNLMKYKEYFGSVEVSLEDKTLYGKLECINDLVTFEASSVEGLESAFHQAVDEYLLTCEECGKSPDKALNGTFNIRIGQDLHKKAYLAAKSQGKSINDLIKSSLEESLSNKREIHLHFNDQQKTISDNFFLEKPKRGYRQGLWNVDQSSRGNH